MQPATTVAEARDNLRKLREARESRHCQQVLGRLANHTTGAGREVIIEALESAQQECRRQPQIWLVKARY